MGGNNASLLEEIRKAKKNITTSNEAIAKAQAEFTNHFNSFLSLAENIENQFKELAERESVVEKREIAAKAREGQLDEREKKCSEKEKKAEEREKAVSMKEEQWNEKEKIMQQNAAKLPSVIQFNVSGQKFAATKELLLRHKGSYFEQVIGTGQTQLTSNGKIFIERDPKYFRHVISFMLNGSLPTPSNIAKKLAIEKEFSFYKIPFTFEVPLIVPHVYFNNLIDESKFANVLREWIPNKQLQLLYKATIDGFGAADFHKLCDNKGATLTIIQSKNGFIFGGFSPLPWDSSGSDKYHNDTFIFTLTNPHNIPPTKYPYNQQSNYRAICCSAMHGPLFGSGSDITVFDNSHQHNNSLTKFPTSFSDTTGKGNNTFTGAYNFTTSEIEVFSVL